MQLDKQSERLVSLTSWTTVALRNGLSLKQARAPEIVNVRGVISAGLGLNDVGKQGGSLGNLNEFGVVLGLSGDPGCGKSMSDSYIHRKEG